MKILRFDLLNGGEDGIRVHADEYFNFKHGKVVDDVKRERHLTLPTDLIDEIQKLKYFYFNLTGHWIPAYSNFYDSVDKILLNVGENPPKPHLYIKDLWRKTTITGALSESGGIMIIGKIETVDSKVVSICTPLIKEDDDVGFFDECMEVLHGIAEKITEFFSIKVIPLDVASKVIGDVAGLSEDEIIDKAINKLADKGAIILMDGKPSLAENTQDERDEDENENEDEEEDDKKKVNTRTNSIDGESLPEAIENEEIADIPNQQPSRKPDPFGPPAADIPADLAGEIPRKAEPGQKDQPGDISHLEYSSEMGIVEDQEEAHTEEEW